MDEQNTANQEQIPQQEPQQPEEPVQQPQTPAPQEQGTVSTKGEYASFLVRFVAALIDSILVGIVVGILAAMFGFTGENEANPFGALGIIYYVFMTYKYSATVGKMAMNIKVQHEDGSGLSLMDVILREVVGKFLSTIVLLLGYFWMLWDPKKQTWHDKLAKSVVVKTK